MDALTLLVILIGVVTMLWMAMSYMEIEQMKMIIHGDKSKREAIQAVEDGDEWTKSNMKIWINHGFECEGIPKLEEGKIYYLCHPCTTGGRSIEENKLREEDLYKRIIYVNKGAKIIRPLKVIPEDMSHEEAMRRCFNMLDATDIIILPMGWANSRGCSQESEWAKVMGKERVLLNTN